MPKTKLRKEQDIQTLSQKLNSAKSVVFANFFGLKVKDTDELRNKCREAGLYCAVLKKNLLSLTLKEKGIEVPKLEGEIVGIFGEDEVVPAKTVFNFSKKHEALKVVAGVIDGQYADFAKVKALSSLPSKEELLAKLVGSINAPVSGFVNVLAGNLRNLVYVLSAIKSSK